MKKDQEGMGECGVGKPTSFLLDLTDLWGRRASSLEESAGLIQENHDAAEKLRWMATATRQCIGELQVAMALDIGEREL